MAVAIEFYNVIVRKSAIELRYFGGLDAFASQDLPNYLEDEHLVRIGFMSSSGAVGFADELKRAGLHLSEDGESDFAIITTTEGSAPIWLSVGEREGQWACWLKGAPLGKLINFDPELLFRLPPLLFSSPDDVVRVLRQSGAGIGAPVPTSDDPTILRLDCTRKGAKIEIDVFTEAGSGRPIGVWGRRILARRTSIESDSSLMADVSVALKNAGVESG